MKFERTALDPATELQLVPLDAAQRQTEMRQCHDTAGIESFEAANDIIGKSEEYAMRRLCRNRLLESVCLARVCTGSLARAQG